MATDLFDPVVFYDDISKRFVVAALESPLDFSTSFLDIAFSDPNDESSFPASLIYRINTQEGNNTADYPRFGFNADAVVFSFNMFDALDNFLGVQILSIDTKSIGSASLTTDKLDRPNDFTDTPASMHGATSGQPMYFVESATTFPGPYTDAHVLTWANPLDTTSSFTDSDITVSSYNDPTSADQKGSTDQIQTNDIRILSVAWRGNRLVATHAIDNASGDPSARWYDFLTDPTNPTSTPTLTQSGTINQGSGVADYFPSIDIDPNGDLGLTFMESSSTEYMSMYVTGQLKGATAGTMLTPVLAQAGVTTYTPFDTAPYRGGDFSGMGVDPTDGSFWSANEYAIAAQPDANYGTWIQQFTIQSGTGTRYIPLANGGDGIGVGGHSNILIGGTSGVAANIIGANSGNGVSLSTTATGVLVEGNFIGTDPNSDSMGNKGAGVLITGNQNTIGGMAQGAGNVISGNSGDGIQVSNSASGTVIQGNLIGLAVGGNNALPNGTNGIETLFGATGTIIDGGNVISGNIMQGISLGITSLNSLVQGNLIGTNATGDQAVNNGQAGISLNTSQDNTIGGAVSGQGNVISGNGTDGIFDNLGLKNLIEGNLIGTNSAGTSPLGNGSYGIEILGGGGTGGASNDTIGGTTSGGGQYHRGQWPGLDAVAGWHLHPGGGGWRHHHRGQLHRHRPGR